MTETLTLNTVLSLQSEESLRDKILFESLAADINYLIQTNFEKLVSLLYRIDVSEAKLKTMLQSNPDTDAGKIIAALLIERQIQKIKLRSQFANPSNVTDEEEKW